MKCPVADNNTISPTKKLKQQKQQKQQHAQQNNEGTPHAPSRKKITWAYKNRLQTLGRSVATPIKEVKFNHPIRQECTILHSISISERTY
jgi:hypothetical protein